MSDFIACKQDEWSSHIARYPEANFLQSWEWGEAHREMGHEIIHHKLVIDDEVQGLVLGIIRDARRGRYLEIAGGPLIDWSAHIVVRDMLAHIMAHAEAKGCVFVRIRPQGSDIDLASYGGRLAKMHLHAEHTNILDITPDPETLLERMRQQTRYEIKRVPKRDLVVSVEHSADALERFTQMQAETAARQHFIPSSPRFLASCQTAFGSSMSIYETRKDGELLNSALVINWGNEADYFEAASSPDARKEPGAYAILWQAINDAKGAGLSRFNFWGVAPNDNPRHRYAKVTTFKRGFGGEDVAYTHAHDFVIKPLAYTKNWIVESLRRKKRNLS